jgi:glutamate carboxypeptidase
MTMQAIADELRTYLEGRLPDYLEMLRQMVAINSFTANADGVNALAQHTAVLFANLGFTAELVQAENPHYGQHLLMKRPGTSGQKVGLVSHLDTVFPPEEEVRNEFFWRPEGERIYGPGTNDIKGGTVLIYMLLDGLRVVAPEQFAATEWHVLLNACEEVGEDDFGRLCGQRLGPDALACLVFEAGAMADGVFNVVMRRKGMALYEATAVGKAAHAGAAHQAGANAVVQLAEVAQRIAALTDYERDLTFNVGVIAGGSVTNRVPHEAMLKGEMRAFDTAVFEQGVAQLLALNGLSTVQNVAGDFACTVQVQVVDTTRPWPQNAATDRLVALWQDAAQRVGYTVQPEQRGGLSDGNHVWDAVPTLDGLGPSGANAHCSERSADGSKDQEYCDLPSFVPKTLVNVTAVLLLLNR